MTHPLILAAERRFDAAQQFPDDASVAADPFGARMAIIGLQGACDYLREELARERAKNTVSIPLLGSIR